MVFAGRIRPFSTVRGGVAAGFFRLDRFRLAQYVWRHGVGFQNVGGFGRAGHNRWLGTVHAVQPTFNSESRHRFHFHRQPYCLGCLRIMEKLATHFLQRLPGGMNYSDAVVLCFWLYLTADGIPKTFLPQLTRQGLADMFAELSRAGWVRQNSDQLSIMQSSHWDGVILSMLTKKEFDIVADGPHAAELVKSFGFSHETPAA